MALVAAAFVPTPPLLVPEVGGGSAAQDESLRSACRQAVADVVAAADQVVVIGAAPTTRDYDGGWDWRGFGVAHPTEPAAVRLPLALAIGSWLLSPRRADRLLGVRSDESPERCRLLGEGLGSGGARVAAIVCGDGTARRTDKAPGHFDVRAAGFDASVRSAVETADVAALLDLDPELAADLMATGRAPWQVLAGAAGGVRWSAELLAADAPYGVFYAVARWFDPR